MNDREIELEHSLKMVLSKKKLFTLILNIALKWLNRGLVKRHTLIAKTILSPGIGMFYSMAYNENIHII